MARKPDVFVRAVSSEEGRKLAQIARAQQAAGADAAGDRGDGFGAAAAGADDREAHAGIGIVCAATISTNRG
ncbi:hypothetical protein [Nocardia vaccinii]|uniref:hypothetical protein n=1 Tax=Nocardia vaccinii TaxID=1822 RepID=UPI000B2A007D